MAGIDDIAKDLQVSTCLVSRVLSGRLGTTRVSQKTATAIRNKAEALGYKKNHAAAALAKGRHGAIAAFVRHYGVAGSGLVDAIVEGIAEEANIRHQRLVLCFYRIGDDLQAKYAEVAANAVDGVIVAGGMDKSIARQLVKIQQKGVAVVTMHHEAIAPQIVNVGCSDVEVGRLATAHLLERGCRRVAHVRVHQERFEGYQQALREAGHPFRPELVFRGEDFELGTGEAAVAHFLEQGLQFDGLFAQSDQLAVGAMNALMRRGIVVPEQVKVIGVDNSPFCRFVPVQLSSVSTEERRRARLAMQLVVDQVQHKPVEPIWLAPGVLPRMSSQERGTQ
jgi:LacI family transcriptional regulator